LSEIKNIEWRRLGIEAAAIVVSILLAFWIDAWWDSRNEENAFTQNLLALEHEILQNLSNFDSVLGHADQVLKELDEVFHILADPDRRDLPVDFSSEVGDAYDYVSSDVSDTALGVVLRPDNLQRIEGKELRHHLARTGANLADVAKYERRLEGEFSDRQLPALARVVVLDEFSWYVDDAPKLQQHGLLHPLPEVPFTSNSEAVRSAEFWNLLWVWRSAYLDYARQILLTKDDYLIALELLEKELTGRR